PKTNVSVTGNVPAQYSHVYMTAQEIWFNSSASATADDTTWKKFPLTTPVTIDLASSVDGQLASIITGLSLAIGTYEQVRLIPVDASIAVVTSATNAGATYNMEADYTDSSGTTHQVPLELLNPDKGLGIQTSIQVSGSGVSVF